MIMVYICIFKSVSLTFNFHFVGCQGSVNTSSTYIQTPNQSASTTFESMASTVQSSIATSDPNNVGNLEMTFTTVQGKCN